VVFGSVCLRLELLVYQRNWWGWEGSESRLEVAEVEGSIELELGADRERIQLDLEVEEVGVRLSSGVLLSS
jgi:hypothetical protein